MWLPVSLSGSLVTGTYRFTFDNIFDIDSLPLITPGKSFTFNGKLVTFTESYKDIVKGIYVVTLKLKENPEPVTVISVGIIGVLGLTLLYMNLRKVEKLVESPSISLAVFVVAAFGALALWRSFKKGGK